MSTATQSLLFNALPLLLLAGAYLVVTAALVPAVWRDRHSAHSLDVATVTIFPSLAFTAAVLAVLVIIDRRPLGGHLWASFAAIVVALVPANLLLARWSERGMLTNRAQRVRDAEELVSIRDRELGAVAEISDELVRASDPDSAARPVVRHVAELLDVDFTGVVLVDEGRTEATGVLAELNGEDVAWWRELQLDLVHEGSAIASAVFENAPVEVYDIESSGRVSRRLSERVGAKSGIWVPMLAEGGRVVGVLVVVTTRARRTFTRVEISLLEALCAETALALDRLRSAGALAGALRREQAIARIARAVRAELEPDEVVRVATEELRAELRLERVTVELGEGVRQGTPIVVAGARIGTLRLERDVPFEEGERFLVETVARELGLALHTARLLAENARRLAQQGALLHASQVVASELELDAVLRRLVEEVTKLLGADAADCYLLDAENGVLRCAAVYGLDEDLLGFEFPAEQGVAGIALARGRPVSSEQYEELPAPVPHRAYSAFTQALVAPMVWGGETRGVLGVGVRDATGHPLGDEGTALLEAFAGLASLALRNAEALGERARQIGLQRAFYRIASALSEPLSLPETCDAAAQAAADALGGDFAEVLMPDSGRLGRVGEYELPPDVASLELPPALVEAAAGSRMLSASRAADDDRLGPGWRSGPFASLLAIPVEGTGPGLALVFFREPRTFSSDDLELARQLALAARGAFERSRLFEAERAARAVSQRLARTGRLLAAELDPSSLVGELVELAAALVEADAAAVASLREDRLEIVAAVGARTGETIGAASPSTGWLGGDVVQLREPVARDDVAADPVLARADPVLELGYRAYLGVPLVGRDGVARGVLAVYGSAPRVWREEEIEGLAALGASASVALTNAELYQRVAIEHAQSAAILANIADGIVAVDRDGRVVAWNAAAERITGVPATEALGRTPAQVLQRDFQSESGGSNRLVSIPRGADEVWLSLSEAVMRDPAGAVAGRIFAFRDISSEWAVEQMRSDFVTTVSHELRTPLTSIYGFAETLLRSDVEFGESERRLFLGYIASESERLTEIVDELLDVAKLESGDLRVDLEPTDVGSIVSDAVMSAAGGNGHRFVLDLEDGRLEVQADPAKLRQIVDQLVDNAVRFSPAGGVVRIEARRRPHTVEVSVADDGAGIAAAHHERIFDKFYRAGDDESGTGLGLFIARGLVSAMGGRINVASEEGRGSRFAFELPAAEDE